MDHVLVTHLLLVEALVLPHGVMPPASRGILGVVDRAFGMLASRSYVKLLDAAWRLFRRPLASIHQDERDEARNESQDDQTYHDPNPVGTPTVHRPYTALPALAQLTTSLLATLWTRHAKDGAL